MRVAVIVCVLALARVAVASADDAATFDATLTTAAGFDHVRHDGKVQVHGGGALACDACHGLDARGRLKGKPGHAQCFGACHGAAPAKKRAKVAYVVPAAQGNVCAACHAPSALAALVAPSSKARAAKAAYPPYRLDPDFGLALSHAKHDRAGAGCATCHDAAGRPAGGRGHDRCSRCHLAPKASTTPSMTACTQCHAAAWGPARSPELVAGPLGLGPSFSHAGHAKVARATTCTACHGAVAATEGHDIPPPRTEDCRACHDGKTAFSTTEACTRCHRGAPTGTIELVRPTARFSHDRHRVRLGGAACASCHALDRRGEAVAPRHAACATIGCHREDFATTTPLICGACHVAIEPWRPLRADALPVAETEFGAAMPHRAHAERGLTCSGCHAIADARRERRPPRGHGACSGRGGCHTADARSARPALTDCAACHRAGSAAARVDDRLAARWSVRARFRHDAHPDTCDACHDGVWKSTSSVPVPSKQDCAACHDGKAAFKMTGHGCRRCHGR